MIKAPISRVETPHEVVQQNSSAPETLANLMFWAFAKFWPRKCDVPAWRALPSCIIASIESVSTAPGNRSPAGFGPLITGMARSRSAKVA